MKQLRVPGLPSRNPSLDLVAPTDPGWALLCNGVDLRGWRNADAAEARWKPGDAAPTAVDTGA